MAHGEEKLGIRGRRKRETSGFDYLFSSDIEVVLSEALFISALSCVDVYVGLLDYFWRYYCHTVPENERVCRKCM